MRIGQLAAGLLLTLLAAQTAFGDVAYSEAVTGDLSNNQAAPTPVALGLGTQSFIGTLRTPSAGDGQDWVAVTIPAGRQLTQIIQASYVSTDTTGFSGFQSGATFAGNPGVEGSYAGYTHYGAGFNGVDLLAMMDGAFGSTGFTRPLGPGTYTFLFQQTGTAATSYQFDFMVVPEPATAALLVSGIAALMLGRPRRP